jgi:hypothetical protein
MEGLTAQEDVVLGKLIETWNEFVKLPTTHSDQNDEFRHALHDLQRQIMFRPMQRETRQIG